MAYTGHTNDVQFLINGDLRKFARYKYPESKTPPVDLNEGLNFDNDTKIVAILMKW